MYVHMCQYACTYFSCIQSISPGMVDTDLLSVYSRAVADLPKLQANDVANAVIYALETPDYVQVKSKRMLHKL